MIGENRRYRNLSGHRWCNQADAITVTHPSGPVGGNLNPIF